MNSNQSTATEIDQQQKNAQEMVHIEQVANYLTHYTYDQLVQTFGNNLFDSVLGRQSETYSNVLGYIQMIRQLFIIDFVLPEKMNTIANQKKNDLVKYIASLKSDTPLVEINAKIKEIDSNFTLPENFSLQNYLTRATEVALGLNNLKNIIASGIADTYLPDVLHLLRLPPDKFDVLSNQLIVISNKLEQEYNRLQQNQDVNSEILNEAINLINQTGRSPLAIEDLRQNKNLGNITDLILQITTAIQVVSNIKAKSMNLNIANEAVLQEIKDYILTQVEI